MNVIIIIIITHVIVNYGNKFQILCSHCVFTQQVWSLLFPSWLSFVLLMWSCVVWVTPKFNAKDTVYYTTPALVLYAIVLLLIQYLYNLDLTEGELESHIYTGLARYHGPPAGAQVLTIGLKVDT